MAAPKNKLGKRTQRKIRTPLSDYIRDQQKKKEITREMIVKNSGSEISMGYLNSILDKGSKNLSAEKIIALARGLDVSIVEMANAFGLDLSVEIAPELVELSGILGKLQPRDRAHTHTLIRNLTEYAAELLDKTNKNGTTD